MAEDHNDPSLGDSSEGANPKPESGSEPELKPDPEYREVPAQGNSEDELEALLAQAGALADQLSNELGVEEDEPAGAKDAPSPPVDETPTLDEELAQLERLADVASTEVAEPDSPDLRPRLGENTAEAYAAAFPESEVVSGDELRGLFKCGVVPPPVASEDIADALAPDEESEQSISEPAPETDDDIPDFMREFLEPESELEPPAEPEPAAQTPELPRQAIETTPVPVQTKPGVIGTGLLQSPVIEPEVEEVAQEPAPEPTGPKTRVGFFARLLATLRRVRAKIVQIRTLGPRLSQAAFRACDLGITLLERAETPLDRFGWRVRVLVGWAAVATFGTAFIVYVLSFL